MVRVVGRTEGDTNLKREEVGSSQLNARLLQAQSVHPFLVALGSVLVLFVVWRLYPVLVVGFASILLALLLRSLANVLSDKAKIPEAWSVVICVLAIALGCSGLLWLFGSQIAAQFNLLAKDLPESATQIVREFSATPWGIWLLGHAQDINVTSVTGQAAGYVAAAFGSVLRTSAYVAVLFFAGTYLAVQPERYRRGLLQLVPPGRRSRAGEVVDLTGITLRKWLVAQTITMAVVGTLTAAGMLLLGVKAPLALGIIAGMFAFVPYVGPILSSVPGLLIAALQGPMFVLYAAALYGAIHFVESNLIIPLVQAEIVKLPPVLTLLATLVFGLFLGPVGVLVAAPLTIVVLVAINTIYVEDILGEQRLWPKS